MRPGPEVAMAVATVVSLHPGSQDVPFKISDIHRDPAGKHRVGVGSPRKSNPTFVTQRHTKGRAPAQIPRDRVPVNLQLAATKAFTDFIFIDLEMEWAFSLAAESQARHGEPLNKTLRFSIPRKHVAHTCTGIPRELPPQPLRPGFISKYRN